MAYQPNAREGFDGKKDHRDLKVFGEYKEALDDLKDYVESRKMSLEEEIEGKLHESVRNANDCLERVQETLEPKFEKMVANSQPMTPAPSMTRLLGNSWRVLMPLLLRMTDSSMGMLGILRGRLPVATIMCFAETFIRVPLFSISTLCGDKNLPHPCKKVKRSGWLSITPFK